MNITLTPEELKQLSAEIALEAIKMAGPEIAKKAIEEYRYADGCLTKKQAEKFLGVSYGTILRYINNGTIIPTVVGTIPKNQLIQLKNKKAAAVTTAF